MNTRRRLERSPNSSVSSPKTESESDENEKNDGSFGESQSNGEGLIKCWEIIICLFVRHVSHYLFGWFHVLNKFLDAFNSSNDEESDYEFHQGTTINDTLFSMEHDDDDSD